MKKNILYSFLLVSVHFLPMIALGQNPVIDSMYVNEDSSHLQIWGDFGSFKGKVFVDSLEMPIVSWADSLCIAAIPVSGKGSAGIVEVGARGYRSVGRRLTSYRLINLNHEYETNPPDYNQGFSTWREFSFHIRTDIETRLLNRLTSAHFEVEIAKDSKYDYSHSQSKPGSPGINESYSKPLTGHAKFYIDSGIITISSSYSYFLLVFKLNYDFNILPEHLGPCGAKTRGNCTDIYNNEFLSPPRWEIIALKETPMALPIDTVYINADTFYFRWTKSRWDVHYQLQAARDSLFSQITIDTLMDTTSYSWAPIMIWPDNYWKVRIMTTEGTSDWSTVAYFQYLPKSIVNHQRDNKRQTIHVIPNPSSDIITVKADLCNLSKSHLRLMNHLGIDCTENVQITNYGDGLAVNLKRLAKGVYTLIYSDRDNGYATQLLVKQ